MLYDLLENLVAGNMNIDSANADQISFIINLMQGIIKIICLIMKHARKGELFGNINV